MSPGLSASLQKLSLPRLILRFAALSSRRKPWVSAELRALMRTRDRAYIIALTSGSVIDLQHFRTARANATNALDTAKNHNIASRLEEAAGPEVKRRELRRLWLKHPITFPLLRHGNPKSPLCCNSEPTRTHDRAQLRLGGRTIATSHSRTPVLSSPGHQVRGPSGH